MPELPRTPFDDLDDTAVLKVQDIAERLDVEPRSVRRAITRGDLPASRACGLRVLAIDAAEWWRARRVSARPVETIEAPPPPPVPTPKPVQRRKPARRRAVAALEYGARLPLPPRGGDAR